MPGSADGTGGVSPRVPDEWATLMAVPAMKSRHASPSCTLATKARCGRKSSMNLARLHLALQAASAVPGVSGAVPERWLKIQRRPPIRIRRGSTVHQHGEARRP